ncbi:MAG: hypothetical protein GXX78_16840 [Bacteroidales bacterium]|nr:hypothetical protein [Bacteroidales bacterium]
MKHRNLSKQLIIWIMPLVCSLLIHACSVISCKLNRDDKIWLLERKDSIHFLKNNSDTITVAVNTGFGKSEYEWVYGFPSGDNDEYGYSEIKIPLSDTIHFFRYLIKSCFEIIRIESYSQYNDKTLDVFRYYANKDSSTNFKYISPEMEYENCFYYSNPEDSIIKEFIFVKKHGIIKFITYQNDLFELLQTE